MKNKIKTILSVITIFLLFVIFSALAAGPTNNPTADTTGVLSGSQNNNNGSFSFPPFNGAAGMNLKSASSSTFAGFQGANNATYSYNIILMDWPTNGLFYGTVTNGTNLILTSVQGYTGNQLVLVAGNTTNQLNITNGIIMNVVPQ